MSVEQIFSSPYCDMHNIVNDIRQQFVEQKLPFPLFFDLKAIQSALDMP